MMLKPTYLLFCHEHRLTVVATKKSAWPALQKQLDSCQSYFQHNTESATTYCTALVDSVPSISMQNLLDDTAKTPLQKTLVNDIFQQDVLLHLDNPLLRFYLVVPDKWVAQETRSLPLHASSVVQSLAGLALASEVSHLVPESLLYHYKVQQEKGHQIDQRESQTTLMQIKVCALEPVEKIQSCCAKKRAFTGVIRLSDCQQILNASTGRVRLIKDIANQSLVPYRPQQLEIKKKCRQWRWLIGAIIATQVSCFSYYQYNKIAFGQLQERLLTQPLIANVAINDQSLERGRQKLAANSEINMPESAYQVATKIMQTLPPTIRLDAFDANKEQASLQLTGTQSQLASYLSLWQVDWPEWDLHMQPYTQTSALYEKGLLEKQAKEASNKEIQRKALHNKAIANYYRTRSVQYVALIIRSSITPMSLD